METHLIVISFVENFQKMCSKLRWKPGWCAPHLLVPQLCCFSSCAPYVSKKLQYWHCLANVIQLS